MHHSREQTEGMKNLARELGLGSTGEHPEGRLTPEDEGAIRIAVGTEGGKVVIHFGKPVAWIGLNAKQARQLAEALRQKSYSAEGR